MMISRTDLCSNLFSQTRGCVIIVVTELNILCRKVLTNKFHINNNTTDRILPTNSNVRVPVNQIAINVKVARYSFSRSIPPKFERKLRRHKQGFRKIDTTIVLDKEENWL